MAKIRTSRGWLVTFEGTEGAGKSTLMRAVAARLQKELGKTRIVQTREPGGTPLSEKIRAIILEHAMNPWTELFLYEAARAEHLNQTILPALEAGSVVLCDRFTDSSLAYQSFARGLPWKDVRHLNSLATRGLSPDLTVLLDIDPGQGLRRAKQKTRFEAEGKKFQTRVRMGFLKAKREEPDRWLVLRAGVAEVETLAEAVVDRLLQPKVKMKKKLDSRAGHGRG